VQLTCTNRPFGLTIKFTRNISRWWFVVGPWSEPGPRQRIISALPELGQRGDNDQRLCADGIFESCRFATKQFVIPSRSEPRKRRERAEESAVPNLFSCEALSSRSFTSLQRAYLANDERPKDERRCYKLSVILPRGFHPFPSRTRKLSPAGPMVLHAKVCGSVGRCRH
jgi:hypothetical protein